MITALISRLVILLLGTLYPAYASYKAVRTKDVKEYVKWMMYWIVFALFTCAETFTDVLLGFWFPFYYELKIAIVLWLLSPATKGSSFLYRNFVHPAFLKRESDIDEYVARCKDKGYDAVMTFGSKGISYATNMIVQTALKNAGTNGRASKTDSALVAPLVEEEVGRRRGASEQDYQQPRKEERPVKAEPNAFELSEDENGAMAEAVQARTRQTRRKARK